MSDRVKQMSSAVHDLSTVLHPSKLEQLGLVAAVRGLCKELAQAHGLAIEFAALPMPTSIPDDTALCLYRIVQEALQQRRQAQRRPACPGRIERRRGRGLPADRR